MVRYVVQPGDTLGNIAVKYRTSVRAIVRANGIRNPDWIQVGQILRIPTHMYDDNNYHDKGHYHDNHNYHHKGYYYHDHNDHYND